MDFVLISEKVKSVKFLSIGIFYQYKITLNRAMIILTVLPLACGYNAGAGLILYI